MADQSTGQGNITSEMENADGSPNVWAVVKGHIGTIMDHAVQRYNFQETDGRTLAEQFKLQFELRVKNPLSHVKAVLRPDRGFPVIHQEINGAVEGAVDGAMQELNMTGTNLADKQSLITSLDTEIEQEISKVFSNVTEAIVDHSNFFERLPIKDETIFVALVSMGIVIPIIFITLLIIFFYKRQKEIESRRKEMLLRDQPEFSMDDYNPEDKSPAEERVPDLDLKRLRASGLSHA